MIDRSQQEQELRELLSKGDYHPLCDCDTCKRINAIKQELFPDRQVRFFQKEDLTWAWEEVNC